MAKSYFESQDFKNLLHAYEEQAGKRKSLYLDAEDFADIADYYLNCNQPDDAMDAIEMGLGMHPDDEALLIVKGATCIYEREYDKAEEVLLKLDQNIPDVVYQMAQLQYTKYMNLPKAEQIWREWMRIDEGGHPSPQKQRENYIHIISSLAELREDEDMEDDKQQETRQAVEKWIREYIDTFGPLGKYEEDAQLADICKDNNLPQLLCEVLTQVLEEQPYLPQGWANLALAHFVQKNYEQALEACDFALAIDPNDMHAMLTKAHSTNCLDDKLGAKVLFKEYLDKGGDIIQIIPYAEMLFFTDEKEEALRQLEKLEKVLDRRRVESEDRYEAVKRNHAKEKERVAIETMLFNEGMELYAKAYCDIGELCHNHDCYEESLACNKKVLEVSPNNVDAYFMMGVNYLSLNLYETASHNFSLALQYARDQVMVGVDIALTFVLNGFETFALEVLDTITKIASQSNSRYVKKIPVAKSLTYLKLGNADLFLENFKEACEKTPRLVRSVYEGYFPEELPVGEWSEYVEKDLDAFVKKFKKENPNIKGK